MILSKDELISTLKNEIRLVVHLAEKAGPEQLEYRPSPKQRSTLELLHYLAIVGPIHLNGIMASSFDMTEWSKAWNAQEAAAKVLNLEQTIAAIAAVSQFYDERLGSSTDEFLNEQVQLFGHTNSRALWILNLVLIHYAAYRMQLFQYLKASGKPELNTMNLWVGVDAPMKPI